MSQDFPLEWALKNKSAAIACSSEKSDALTSGLEAMGAAVLVLNVIALHPIPDNRDLDAALDDLDRYDWVVISSTHGAQFFVLRMQQRRVTLKDGENPRLCAVGPATAKFLRESGLRVDLIPEEFVAEGILRALAKYYGDPRNLAGRRFLLPRAQEARDVLPQALLDAGAIVDVVPCYRNVPGSVPPAVVHRLKAAPPDLLVFTSSSTVKNFLTIMGSDEGRRVLQAAKVAALGPITAATIQNCGKKVEILPKKNTIPSLLEAIRKHFSTD
jgi:uroporphyrinogen III methyltransferase / synthase